MDATDIRSEGRGSSIDKLSASSRDFCMPLIVEALLLPATLIKRYLRSSIVYTRIKRYLLSTAVINYTSSKPGGYTRIGHKE